MAKEWNQWTQNDQKVVKSGQKMVKNGKWIFKIAKEWRQMVKTIQVFIQNWAKYLVWLIKKCEKENTEICVHLVYERPLRMKAALFQLVLKDSCSFLKPPVLVQENLLKTLLRRMQSKLCRPFFLGCLARKTWRAQ